MKKLLTSLLLILSLSSCILNNNLGDFTLMSVNNVGDLDKVKSESVYTEGESCIQNFLIYITTGTTNGRQKEATRNAVRNGRKKLPGGNILIDAVVDTKSYNFFLYNKNCVIVRGHLANFSKK